MSRRMPLPPCLSALAVLLALGSPTLAHADPALNNDAVAELLVARGLIPSSPPLPPESAAADPASSLVVLAMGFLGVPYQRGGNSFEAGFDCSGFTRHIFQEGLGLLLPRKVDDQASAAGLRPVKRSDLQPGDLVFFNTLRRQFSHVGIYVGDDRFIHAPRSGSEIRVERLSVSYWTKRFTGARRAAQALLPAPAELPAADNVY